MSQSQEHGGQAAESETEQDLGVGPGEAVPEREPLGDRAQLLPAADEQSRLPPKARFQHAHKRALSDGLGDTGATPPPEAQPGPSAAQGLPRGSPPSFAPADGAGPSTSTFAAGAPYGSVGLDPGASGSGSGAALQDSDDEDPDPLRVHHGPKSVRLSVSKIQGFAEYRKPRIGSQFQACVPPWPPGQL
ncbi:hypothetical protein HYH03_000464 [Edaphochlamys debaryana]|uniref:Uncharacterized protein n=1 Tax=Edaphochlamys debaryana TaxID=47281 RepID=A0A835YIR0_9CHLO|nr:hypothetical protein HYH03_000464 [Edaphochlamys debaryana]|eukprot:KAG2501968.1 hypothetical protein HYH03_000464 [Edaphochlamys debaryana]